MNFTTEQVVDLIVNFYYSYPYTYENIDSFPEAKIVFENGYAYKDEDNNIRISSAGKDFFHPYIQKYSEIVIKHFLARNNRSSISSLANDLVNELGVDDYMIIVELAEYLIKNLPSYGYAPQIIHDNKGDFIEIIKN